MSSIIQGCACEVGATSALFRLGWIIVVLSHCFDIQSFLILLQVRWRAQMVLQNRLGHRAQHLFDLGSDIIFPLHMG